MCALLVSISKMQKAKSIRAHNRCPTAPIAICNGTVADREKEESEKVPISTVHGLLSRSWGRPVQLAVPEGMQPMKAEGPGELDHNLGVLGVDQCSELCTQLRQR